MSSFQYNPQSYISAQSPEFQQANLQDIIDYANLGMFIPFQVSSYLTATIAEKVNIDIYLELFGILRQGYQTGILSKNFLAQFLQTYNKLPFNRKAELNGEIYESLKQQASVLGLVLESIEDENEGMYGIDTILEQLPDKERLQMLYYMSTGEELTEELQTYLEQDLQESGASIDNLTSDQVAYLAQTATQRYTDRGAIVVNDSEVQIPNTNNPNSARANTPITRERLKEMMNSQTNVVDELRQKNTKAYSNIPGLNRPNMPVSKSQTLFKAESISPSTTNLANSDYNDYE